MAYSSQFLGPIPNVIVFQYNPAQLTRSLAMRTPPREGDSSPAAREETFAVKGPPKETISLTIELDAADQLENPATHPHTVVAGLTPALAAMELLLYPDSTQILLNQALAAVGSVQLQTADVPLVLFVWGASRVLPVRLTEFSITEQAFDTLLNPIRAQVQLKMRVMTYMELEEASLGRTAYIANLVKKEALARLNLVNSAEQILGLLPF